jgi:hypothetical protein
VGAAGAALATVGCAAIETGAGTLRTRRVRRWLGGGRTRLSPADFRTLRRNTRRYARAIVRLEYAAQINTRAARNLLKFLAPPRQRATLGKM